LDRKLGYILLSLQKVFAEPRSIRIDLHISEGHLHSIELARHPPASNKLTK